MEGKVVRYGSLKQVLAEMYCEGHGWASKMFFGWRSSRVVNGIDYCYYVLPSRAWEHIRYWEAACEE